MFIFDERDKILIARWTSIAASRGSPEEQQSIIYHSEKHQAQSIVHAELDHIFPAASGVLLCIYLIGYHTRQGSDDCAHPADIYPEEQLPPVGIEFRQKDRAGYIADDLT